MKLRILVLVGAMVGAAAGVALAITRMRREDQRFVDDVRRDEELLDEIGAESFPSSDPPATWAGPDRPSTSGH